MTACIAPHPDNRDPHQAEHGQLCRPAYLRLEQHLAELPARSAWLHANLAAGGAGRSDMVTGTRDKPVPIKISVHDHLELIRGTLTSWATLIAEERDLRGPANNHVNTTATFLVAHLDWSAHQPWINDLCSEINDLTRTAHQLAPSNPGKHHLPAPCPSCDLLALEREDGADYVECQNCGRLWQQEEYQRLVVVLAAESRRAS